MIAIMAYVALLSACIAAAAVACESICRALRRATRWAWIAGLSLALVATVAVMLWPLPEAEVLLSATAPAAPSAIAVREVSEPFITAVMLERAGFAAAAVWAGSSVLLLGLLAVGAVTLMRERRLAGRSVVHGHDVLLTDGVGPAVAGLAKPVALIPRWVLEMDEASQRLLLAHEMEHVRARDSVLLVSGAVVAALLPWNPLVWWMLRRLRLAVEMDCDGRVLAREASIRRYAELLLMTARIPSEHARFLVAGLGENESDLERRILAMTERSPRRWLTRAVVPAALAAGLIVAACETPRPDPVGPSALGLDREPAAATVDSSWVEVELELKAEPHYHFNSLDSSKLAIAYEEVPMRDLERLEPKREAVAYRRSGGDSMKFAEIRKILPSRMPLRLEPKKSAARLRVSEAPWFVPQDTSTATGPAEVVILSSDGRRLATERSVPGKGTWSALSRLDPEQIAMIEILKGAACPGTCPRLTVTLKAGASLQTAGRAR